MASKNTESTAVNELIELVATQQPLPPDPDEDLMFTEVKPAKKMSPTRVTSTVPPIRGAGEVEPLPRTRAPNGTQQGLPTIRPEQIGARSGKTPAPGVRVTTAPPQRVVTIPPLTLDDDETEETEVTNPGPAMTVRGMPAAGPSVSALQSRPTRPTLPPPTPAMRHSSSPTLPATRQTSSSPTRPAPPSMRQTSSSPALPRPAAPSTRQTSSSPALRPSAPPPLPNATLRQAAPPPVPSAATRPSTPPPAPPLTLDDELPPGAYATLRSHAPLTLPDEPPLRPSLQETSNFEYPDAASMAAPPQPSQPSAMPVAPFASAPAFNAMLAEPTTGPTPSLSTSWIENDIGTQQVQKSDLRSLAGKLVAPMIIMVIAGIFIGGYFAFDGDGGKKRPTAGPAEGAKVTMPVTTHSPAPAPGADMNGASANGAANSAPANGTPTTGADTAPVNGAPANASDTTAAAANEVVAKVDATAKADANAAGKVDANAAGKTDANAAGKTDANAAGKTDANAAATLDPKGDANKPQAAKAVPPPTSITPPNLAATAPTKAEPAATHPAIAAKFVDIRIDSDPPGATVMLIDRGKSTFLGTTPMSAAVDPSRKYELVFSHENRATTIEPFDPAKSTRVAVHLSRVRGASSTSAAVKTEAPKIEAPKTEAPKIEAAKTEAAKTEAPKTEVPKAEAKADVKTEAKARTEAPKTKPEAPKTKTEPTSGIDAAIDAATAAKSDKAQKVEKTDKTTDKAQKVEKTEKTEAKETKAEPAAKVEAKAAGEGTLMISSKPPCEIEIDGKVTGLTTPQRAIPLPAGPHKITLVNSAEGIKKTVSVQITADKPTKVIQDFMK